MASLAAFFTNVIYQPFLNILVFFYWVLGYFMENPDMGVAVILLTILIRILMLPLTISGERSEKDRREIAEKVHEIEQQYSHDPVEQKKQRKKVFKKNRRILFAEIAGLVVQIAVALILWRMFETGLPGDDVDLIYPFMPAVETPFNLTFLEMFDLTKSSWTLNILLSIMIFLVETVSILTSPYPPERGEVVRLQLTLPIVSFFIFMRLPAGKMLFVIVTLFISLLFKIILYIRRRFLQYKDRWEHEQQDELEGAGAGEEQVLVDVKA
jgi:YidC/Oxa1 family membrane protein insertase